MSARWIQVPPGRREETTALAVAGAIAAAAGVAMFWLVRTLLSRELLEDPAARREELAKRSVESE